MTTTPSRGLRLAIVASVVLGGVIPVAGDDSRWFVSFERIQVAPVERSNTTQLVDAGSIDTDGFSELVFSLGGEFKEGIPESGKVGVVLIPDKEVFLYLLQTEGEFVFPLEAQVEIGKQSSAKNAPRSRSRATVSSCTTRPRRGRWCRCSSTARGSGAGRI
ncbi:MAG: hypothetical protein ACYS0E_22145 [Planctomycetota bacterium]|jgi:hypothetical protein